MSTINDISTNKPLEFYGIKTTVSDDPFFVEMAQKSGMEHFRYVSAPVTETTELTVEDSKSLLDYLKTCCWREDFDNNLQCLSESEDGEPFLTGWMPMSRFEDFVQTTSQPDFPICEVSRKLAEMIRGWREKDVQDVSFSGYLLPTFIVKDDAGQHHAHHERPVCDGE